MIPDTMRLLPLYGAGFDNLGHDGQPVEVPVPHYGPDELLVRHDACGLCFSDIKVIRAGQAHPRIYRDMQVNSVVLGHEVTLTVVGVGEHLRDQYRAGDRFIVQADIYVDGVGYAYGYEIQGGLSQYNVIDQRVLNGDHGCYLIPVQSTTGYAEAALTEPWACVEASYNVVYRTRWRDEGTVWIVGDGRDVQLGRAQIWHPLKVVLDVTDDGFAARVRAWADGAGIEIGKAGDEAYYDDIVVLGADEELIERVSPWLAKGGILNLVAGALLARPVQVDVGRLHYDHLTIVGTGEPDLSVAYTPIRSRLKPSGQLWALGAGGPMGQMHVQRALEIPEGPGKIVATGRRLLRISKVGEAFAAPAQERGIELVCLSHEVLGEAALASELHRQTSGRGFDDIVVLAPSPSSIESAVAHLSIGGVMNIFAGLPRGTLTALDLNAIVHRGARFTGSSGSSIEDLRHMRDLMESHTLSPNRSVVAIAGLEGAAEGLRALAEGCFSGKVVVYPNIEALPLTPLSDLKDVLPSVYARLKDGRQWTVEAEAELLRAML
jgi:threonine dehydrogenase-like Zn-dependent dehydrogenase